MLMWIIAFLWLALDQITKHTLPLFFNWYESTELIPGLLRITLVKNDGAAFGFLSGRSGLFIIVAIGFIVFLFIKRDLFLQSKITRIGAPLAGAGALGNVIDRIFFGYVIDFIDVPFFSIFNVADIGIVVGIGLLAIGFYQLERDHKDVFDNS
jgi:signal peptidase II